MSNASKGFVDVAAGTELVLSNVRPVEADLVGGVGVLPLEAPTFCSPSLIKVSTVRSRLPLSPLSTVQLRFSSGKPISRRVASFESSPSPDVWTFDPKIRDGLFTRGGDSSCSKAPMPGDKGGVRSRGAVAALRNPKPKRPVGLGGNGGGLSSELVLPVFCCPARRTLFIYTRCSYFWRMYRSMALSTSSMSIGIWGLTLRGLYVLFDSTFPMRFIF